MLVNRGGWCVPRMGGGWVVSHLHVTPGGEYAAGSQGAACAAARERDLGERGKDAARV